MDPMNRINVACFNVITFLLHNVDKGWFQVGQKMFWDIYVSNFNYNRERSSFYLSFFKMNESFFKKILV